MGATDGGCRRLRPFQGAAQLAGADYAHDVATLAMLTELVYSCTYSARDRRTTLALAQSQPLIALAMSASQALGVQLAEEGIGIKPAYCFTDAPLQGQIALQSLIYI